MIGRHHSFRTGGGLKQARHVLDYAAAVIADDLLLCFGGGDPLRRCGGGYGGAMTRQTFPRCCGRLF